MKALKTQKSFNIVAVIFMLVSGVLLAGNYMVPRLTKDQVLEALEVEIASGVSLLEKPASYIIGQVDSYTYMLNGTTGRLDLYSTNASQVIQNAIDNVPDGGQISLKAGKYELGTTSLQIPYDKCLAIIGEGTRSLALATQIRGAVLDYTGNGYAIDSSNLDPYPSDEIGTIIIKRIFLYLHASGGNNSGINLEMFEEGTLEDVKVLSQGGPTSGTIGVRIKNTGTGEHFLLNKVHVQRFDKGFSLSAAHIHGISCQSVWCNYGFYGEDGVDGFSIWVRAQAYQTTYEAFRFNNHHVTLLAPYIEGINDASGVAIDFGGGYQTIFIINPSFTQIISGAKYFEKDAGTLVKIISNDLNFKSFESGEATITSGNTYVDVAHDLFHGDLTPDLNKFNVVPKENIGSRSFYISNVNTTHFRVNLSSSNTSDHTFAWSYRD